MITIEQKISQAIQEIYTVFSSYKKPQTLKVCCEQCFSQQEAKEILAKPLRELTFKDFASYLNAPVIAGGDINDFKFFLPRILELHSQLQEPEALKSIFNHLGEADYRKKWNNEEIQSINHYVILWWEYCLSRDKPSISYELCDILSTHFDIEILLDLWDKSVYPTAIEHLISFVYDGGFADKCFEGNKYLHDWLKSDRIKQKVEKIFYECTDKIKQEKIDFVYNLIESLSP